MKLSRLCPTKLTIYLYICPLNLVLNHFYFMQRFIQTLDLIDDPGIIREYVNIHAHVWPEILHGIRQAGISRMDIYILGNRLMMVLELPDGLDFDETMKHLASLPRQAEWEEYVGKFQNCLQKTTSAGKWQRMTKIFSLDPAES